MLWKNIKKIKLINYFSPQRTQRFLFKDTSKKHNVHKTLYWLSFVNFVFFIKEKDKKLSVLCGYFFSRKIFEVVPKTTVQLISE